MRENDMYYPFLRNGRSRDRLREVVARGPRTSLRLSVEAQAYFNLLAVAGPAALQTAALLVQCGFDLTRAALAFGLGRECSECAKGRRADAVRGCLRCQATIRQRTKRALDRMRSIVPETTDQATTERKATFGIPIRRRPTVRFGADGGSGPTGEGVSIYERTGDEDEQLEALADKLLEDAEA
jgi:hypothetical protein